MAAVVNFMFFARGLTGVSRRVRDVHVDSYKQYHASAPREGWAALACAVPTTCACGSFPWTNTPPRPVTGVLERRSNARPGSVLPTSIRKLSAARVEAAPPAVGTYWHQLSTSGPTHATFPELIEL
eukprot:jgi/Tetstr1/421940/TSEL_012839.t1